MDTQAWRVLSARAAPRQVVCVATHALQQYLRAHLFYHVESLREALRAAEREAAAA